MINYKEIPVKRNEDGYLCWTKENVKIIADYFLVQLNYAACLNTEDPLTSAYLLHTFGFNEETASAFSLSAKEKKAKKPDEWKLIDLIIFRINQEYKTRMSARDMVLFAKEVRKLLAEGKLLDGLKNRDMHMLQDMALNGTSFCIKFASLFCKLACMFHPDLGPSYRDHFLVTDFKRLTKYDSNPQCMLANTAYMRHIDQMQSYMQLHNYKQPPEEKLTLTETWLLDLISDNI